MVFPMNYGAFRFQFSHPPGLWVASERRNDLLRHQAAMNSPSQLTHFTHQVHQFVVIILIILMIHL